MKSHISYLIVYLISLFSISSYAQTNREKTDTIYRFSLKQSVQYALANQPNIKNANYEVGKADAKVKQIRGTALPQISGFVNALDYLQIPTTLVPGQFLGYPADEFIPFKFGAQYNATGEIDASQTLFDGTVIVGLKASKVYRLLSQENLTLAEIEAVAAVKKAYYQVLVNDWQLQMSAADANRLKNLLNETEKMYEAGFNEKVDVDRLKVNYNNVTTQETKVAKMLTLSYKMLKFQMGMPLADSIMLTDSLQSIPINPGLEPDTTFRPQNRIEYTIAQTTVWGNHELVKKDRYAYFPTLTFNGTLNRINMGVTDDFFSAAQPWYPTSYIGLRMNIPIFDGLQKNYIIQQDKYSLQESELQLNTIKQSISLDIANSSTSLENALADLENQKENMALAQSVEHDTKVKYEAGTGSNLEVVDAETALTEAETNYYNALYSALVAEVDYEQAKGTLYK